MGILSEEKARETANINYLLAQKDLLTAQVTHDLAEESLLAKESELDAKEVAEAIYHKLTDEKAKKEGELVIINKEIIDLGDAPSVDQRKSKEGVEKELVTIEELLKAHPLVKSTDLFNEVSTLRLSIAQSAQALAEKEKVLADTKGDADRTVEIPSSEKTTAK